MSTPNPTFPQISQLTWAVPVANTDPSLPFSAAELTGYSIGVRADGASSPGTYTVNASLSDPAATSEALTALGTVLAPGNYWAAIKASGAAGIANDSAYSEEFGFSVPTPPLPTPNPPSNFSGV